MLTLEKWQSFRVRFPYEAPEAEVLTVRIEERFLQGTNSDGNERPIDGDDTDFGD